MNNFLYIVLLFLLCECKSKILPYNTCIRYYNNSTIVLGSSFTEMNNCLSKSNVSLLEGDFISKRCTDIKYYYAIDSLYDDKPMLAYHSLYFKDKQLVGYSCTFSSSNKELLKSHFNAFKKVCNCPSTSIENKNLFLDYYTCKDKQSETTIEYRLMKINSDTVVSIRAMYESFNKCFDSKVPTE